MWSFATTSVSFLLASVGVFLGYFWGYRKGYRSKDRVVSAGMLFGYALIIFILNILIFDYGMDFCSSAGICGTPGV